MMIYVIVGLSFLFIGIGFLLTEKNARYLLSGYNTMSEEERKKVDIRGYIPFYRKFHFGLGLSFLVLGSILTWLNRNAGGIFMATYPIMAYIWFIWRSRQYYKGMSSRKGQVGVGVLVATLVLVIGLLGFGFQEVDLLIKEDEGIEMEGIYGETLEINEIESIELVEELPPITYKTNGFALGHVHKGYFKTQKGEMVKLMLNSQQEPLILIRKKSGDKIYFSSRNGAENRAILNDLMENWPHLIRGDAK